MDVEAFFEGIEQKISVEILNATTSIKIAMAYFTNKAIFDLICTKAKNGTNVELIISDEDINFKNNLFFDALIDAGGRLFINVNKGDSILHHKFCVIDNHIIISGSFNLSLRARKNYENILIVRTKNVVQQYIEEFEKLKSISVQRAYNHDSYTVQTKITSFDEAFNGFNSSSNILFSCKNSTTLTSLIISFINSITEHDKNIHIGYISLYDNVDTIGKKIASIASDTAINKGKLSEHELIKLSQTISSVANKNITLTEINKAKVDNLQFDINLLMLKYTCKLIIVDGIGKFSNTLLSPYNIDDNLESAIRETKIASKRYNIPVISTVENYNKPNFLTIESLGRMSDYFDTIYYLRQGEDDDFNNINKHTYTLECIKNNQGVADIIKLDKDIETMRFRNFPIDTSSYFEKELFLSPSKFNRPKPDDDDAPF